MNFDNKLNKFKIFKLQNKYKKITELVNDFEKHVNNLYKGFFIKDKGKINLPCLAIFPLKSYDFLLLLAKKLRIVFTAQMS